MTPEFKELELDSLYISPYNVRQDPGDLTELIASIKDIGVLEPILVQPMGEGYEIVAGSRRFKAAQTAGLTTIPARVLELTDVHALVTSLIENIQRKDLTLVERVVAYQQLEALKPEYHSKRRLAKAIGRSHRKVGEDFQAYEIALILQPHGIRVESHFPRSSPERQRGDVLPEYHAVLLHQVSSWLRAKDVIPDDLFVNLQVEWARRIAPHSQENAEEIIAHLKSVADSMDMLLSQETPARSCTSRDRKAAATTGKESGFVTCSCCDQVLQLVHRADGTHAVVETPITGQPVLPVPVFSDELVGAALNPAPATLATLDAAPVLEASETTGLASLI
jgi:ParB/RepB/Spo0J family partition protein